MGRKQIFTYQALDADSDFRMGRARAESAEEAEAELKAKGLEPLWIWPGYPGIQPGAKTYRLPMWKLARDDGAVLEYEVTSSRFLLGVAIWLAGAVAVTVLVMFFRLTSPFDWIFAVAVACVFFLSGAALMLMKGKLRADRVTGELRQRVRLGPVVRRELAVDMREVAEVVVTGRQTVEEDSEGNPAQHRVYEVALKKKDGAVVKVDFSSSPRPQYEMGRKIAHYFGLPLTVRQEM
jgi:hypothetical protein